MELIEYLPSFYCKTEEVRNIQVSIGLEKGQLQRAIKDILDQLFIETATWGLEHWEKYVGLAIDREESLENRRSRVMTRLRGQGTTTKEMLKNVCKSFTGGEVAVLEASGNYNFIIKFIDIRGIPGNINYLINAIEEIKPAHLSFSFEYTYNTWRNFKETTWGELAITTWEQIKVIGEE